jgi:hypothetical protein
MWSTLPGVIYEYVAGEKVNETRFDSWRSTSYSFNKFSVGGWSGHDWDGYDAYRHGNWNRKNYNSDSTISRLPIEAGSDGTILDDDNHVYLNGTGFYVDCDGTVVADKFKRPVMLYQGKKQYVYSEEFKKYFLIREEKHDEEDEVREAIESKR